ncbi:MAG: rhomboid family intramembrane serine protease [Phormidesmis sp.]
MVSLRAHNLLASTPVVVYGLIALNLSIYLYETSLDGAALQHFLDLWAIVPKQLTLELAGQRLTTAHEWPTLITFQFLHAGWFHLLGNLFCLWIFGRKVEACWGHAAFLAFYLVCGGFAGLAQWMFEPVSILPTLGASGAIAGIMGAYIVRFPRAKIALCFIGFWFAQQVFYGALSWSEAGLHPVSLGDTAQMTPANIAYAAHAGGFVVGVALSLVVNFLANSHKRYAR